MTDEFNEERARKRTVEALHLTSQTLHANRELCMQILVQSGAPDEAAAQAMKLFHFLLGAVAGQVSEGPVYDAMIKLAAKH